MRWKCHVCGKEYNNFGFKEFAICPKTTLFGKFRVINIDGSFCIVNKKSNVPVCSEECKQNNENQYLVEIYNGYKIYCVDGKYMPYLDCDYWYDSIEEMRYRIDNPNFVPVTHNFINSFRMALAGEPCDI